jgi:hypothetical protein
MSTTDSSDKQPVAAPGKAGATRGKGGTGNTTENASSEKSSPVSERQTKKSAPVGSPEKPAGSSKVKSNAGGTDPYQSGRRVWPD